MAKIIIVDDSEITRMVIRAMLQALGHEIIGEASNGQDAYDMYFELKPDLMTMDITMPILDGVSCTEKIKKRDKNARILLLTSNEQIQKLSQAVSAGLDGYMYKPISEAELKNTVDRILKKKPII